MHTIHRVTSCPAAAAAAAAADAEAADAAAAEAVDADTAAADAADAEAADAAAADAAAADAADAAAADGADADAAAAGVNKCLKGGNEETAARSRSQVYTEQQQAQRQIKRRDTGGDKERQMETNRRSIQRGDTYIYPS